MPSSQHYIQYHNADRLGSYPTLKAEGTNYVEVAQIKPVKHGGQSILGNIIVLCPNHHKEFDYGLLKIEVQTEELLQEKLNGKSFQIEMK